MPVTLAEVARRAGVSTGTASRVLNNKMVMPIPQPTVDRIRKAARELDYTPNRHARALVTRRTHALGFFSQEITDPHGAALLDTIQGEARRRGYPVVVSSRLETLCGGGQTDGVIAFYPPYQLPAGAFPAQPILPPLDSPVIHVYPAREAVPNTIGWSDYDGAREAARYLASLGHRKAAGIYAAGSPDKAAGFAAGAAESNMEVVSFLEQEEPLDYQTQAEYLRFFLGSGYRLARRMIAERPDVTAVFARNDVLAAAVLQALRDAAVSVPEQVSVISYNDSLVAACAAPPLTAIRTPIQEAGRLAVERLIRAIEGAEQSFAGVLLPSLLVPRASTAAVRPSPQPAGIASIFNFQFSIEN